MYVCMNMWLVMFTSMFLLLLHISANSAACFCADKPLVSSASIPYPGNTETECKCTRVRSLANWYACVCMYSANNRCLDIESKVIVISLCFQFN